MMNYSQGDGARGLERLCSSGRLSVAAGEVTNYLGWFRNDATRLLHPTTRIKLGEMVVMAADITSSKQNILSRQIIDQDAHGVGMEWMDSILKHHLAWELQSWIRLDQQGMQANLLASIWNWAIHECRDSFVRMTSWWEINSHATDIQ